VERVAFVVEDTQQRLTCLLNPNTVVMRRVAAVRPQESVSGSFTGTGLSDDPLLYTGGGRTELELDLLFDVSLAERRQARACVRAARTRSGAGSGRWPAAATPRRSRSRLRRRWP